MREYFKDKDQAEYEAYLAEHPVQEVAVEETTADKDDEMESWGDVHYDEQDVPSKTLSKTLSKVPSKTTSRTSRKPRSNNQARWDDCSSHRVFISTNPNPRTHPNHVTESQTHTGRQTYSGDGAVHAL